MSSRFPLSLDWIAENRPDLLPSVDMEGYPVNARHEEPEWDDPTEVVQRALSRLSPDRRALVHAVAIRGLSNREYAKFRGVNESSVRRQLRRTLKTMKRLIEDDRNHPA